MKHINEVHLLGTLPRDPDIKRVGQKGTELLTFSLCMEEKWKDKVSGEWKKKPTFIRVQSWEQDVIEIGAKLFKGMTVEVKGCIQTGNYEKNGTKVYTTDIGIKRDGMLKIAGDGDGHHGKTELHRPHDDMPQDEVPF